MAKTEQAIGKNKQKQPRFWWTRVLFLSVLNKALHGAKNYELQPAMNLIIFCQISGSIVYGLSLGLFYFLVAIFGSVGMLNRVNSKRTAKFFSKNNSSNKSFAY